MTEAQDDDGDDDEESGKTATFPFLNRLFGSSNPPAEKSDAPSGREEASKGARLSWMAEKLQSLGVREALNLDGGGTAALMFMGRVLNRSEKNMRSVGSLITFGESRLALP